MNFGFTILFEKWTKEKRFYSEVENTRGIVSINVLKKEKFEKDLVILVETNHQFNMTSQHSVSSNKFFISHSNANSLNMF